VIEINGAVDSRDCYSFPGRDVFDDAMAALAGALGETPVEAVAAVPT